MVFLLTHHKNVHKEKLSAQILLLYSQKVDFDDKFWKELLAKKYFSIKKQVKWTKLQDKISFAPKNYSYH